MNLQIFNVIYRSGERGWGGRIQQSSGQRVNIARGSIEDNRHCAIYNIDDGNDLNPLNHCSNQVNKLRSSIQTLTKSAHPLGKLMDFLQEDVDSMQVSSVKLQP